MQFLRQVLVQDETLTVSTVRTDDLPVNPVSMILMTIKGTNSTATLTDYQVVSALLAQIAKVEVLFQGSAIISGTLGDLARLSSILIGKPPKQLKMTHVNGDVRGVCVPIILGRRPYWPEECFPSVRRGELQLQTTVAAAQTGLGGLSIQVETVELLGANPSRYMKSTTISKTPSATGDHDVDLPLGNRLAGTLLFGTTAPTGASLNASIGQLRLLVDNVEAYYARANWESLLGDLQLRCPTTAEVDSLTVLENTAAAYAQFATSDKQNNTGFFDNYRYLDLDASQNDMWLLDTKGRARVHLRINADVADAIRIMPVELIAVAGS